MTPLAEKYWEQNYRMKLTKKTNKGGISVDEDNVGGTSVEIQQCDFNPSFMYFKTLSSNNGNKKKQIFFHLSQDGHTDILNDNHLLNMVFQFTNCGMEECVCTI